MYLSRHYSRNDKWRHYWKIIRSIITNAAETMALINKEYKMESK